MAIDSLRPAAKRGGAVRAGGWLALLSVSAFLVAFCSTNDLSMTDPRGTLLLSQAVLDGHGFRLETLLLSAEEPGYQFERRDDHVYYSFPIGTSLAALPAVWLANAAGMDMRRPVDARKVGNIVSAVTLAAFCLLCFALARRFLSPCSALLLTALFTFGSSITSTLGQALFSHDLSVVLLTAAVIQMVALADTNARPDGASAIEGRRASRRTRCWRGGFLAATLFAAYLCRPTAAIATAVAAALLAVRCRRALVSFLPTWAGLFAALIIASQLELGQILPDYYLPGRVGHMEGFGTALFGNLVSPSRGLLVFNPFLLPFVAVTLVRIGQLSRQSLWWAAILWFSIHLTVVSSFPHWWGGGGYGSRLLTEAFPALVLATALAWRERASMAVSIRRILTGATVLFGCAGILINVFQGLYNPAVLAWIAEPSIDDHPERLFDWRQPQFLASQRSLQAIGLEHELSELPPRPVDRPITADSSDVLFRGFSVVERTADDCFRWSDGRKARMTFRLASESDGTNGRSPDLLEIRAGAFGDQEIEVLLNDRSVGRLRMRGLEPAVHSLQLHPDLVRPGVNSLEIEIPNARRPASGEPGAGDLRMLGITLWTVSFSSTVGDN